MRVRRTCAEEYGRGDVLLLTAIYGVLVGAGVVVLIPSRWAWVYLLFVLQAYAVMLWSLCAGCANYGRACGGLPWAGKLAARLFPFRPGGHGYRDWRVWVGWAEMSGLVAIPIVATAAAGDRQAAALYGAVAALVLGAQGWLFCRRCRMAHGCLFGRWFLPRT